MDIVHKTYFRKPTHMPANRRTFLKHAAAGAIAAAGTSGALRADDQPSTFLAWDQRITRVGLGPNLWGNRLQDWRVSNGRLECVCKEPSLPMRTAHLLARSLKNTDGDFELSVRLGIMGDGVAANSAAGFFLGAGQGKLDYRGAALIHGTPGPGAGLLFGINGNGQLLFHDFEKPLALKPGKASFPAGNATLHLRGSKEGNTYTLQLTLRGVDSDETIVLVEKNIDPKCLVGNLALFSHPGGGPNAAGFWFHEWKVAGSKIAVHDECTFGPILGTQYTLHRGILKLTAQLMPIGETDEDEATLAVEGKNRAFHVAARSKINRHGYTAEFRLPNWDSSKEVRYRVGYTLSGEQPSHFDGVIRPDPAKKEKITLAALSCVQQVNGSPDRAKQYNWLGSVWFPHADMTSNVTRHDPDLLFFAGDQIYEGNPTRVVRKPEAEAELDYLYKWFLWVWSYRDLTRNRPTVTIPDDHDVYHGNIWGVGGKAAREGDPGGLLGGYGMPPEWLNMMQRTQTSHLPDPYDPTPAEQGIGAYYTSLVWGEIGFAILEDRKFKSPPTAIGNVRMTPDSHILDKDFDTRKADIPGGSLLGERQEKFLRAFAEDWSGQVMKVALSQTIFCNLQISSRGETAGQLDKDLDSNGWPQSGRKRALVELRRGHMLHIAGDQHLASVIRHGIDDFDDGPWSFCVPAVANLYVRFWNPDYPPLNHREGMPEFTGRYEDGFHNKITVHAVANPTVQPKPGQFPEPVELHRKAVGYGIIRFDKSKMTATLECWPRYANPTDAKTGKQYAGWPITIAMKGRK